MPNELPLPPELSHLIEKREGQDRRGEKHTETSNEQPPETDTAADNRRTGSDRRDQTS